MSDGGHSWIDDWIDGDWIVGIEKPDPAFVDDLRSVAASHPRAPEAMLGLLWEALRAEAAGLANPEPQHIETGPPAPIFRFWYVAYPKVKAVAFDVVL